MPPICNSTLSAGADSSLAVVITVSVDDELSCVHGVVHTAVPVQQGVDRRGSRRVALGCVVCLCCPGLRGLFGTDHPRHNEGRGEHSHEESSVQAQLD